MQIERVLRSTLSPLQQVLSGLSQDEYARPLQILNNSSIGQHTRHIIEFFQVLINDYEKGLINYDKRKRNQLLETSPHMANHELAVILDTISMVDKEIVLAGVYSNEIPFELAVKSTYNREILYNLEHAVHHMAMIKIGIQQSTKLKVSPNFGVASATVQHRKTVL